MNVRKELRASLKRRGMAVPNKPYVYEGERYTRPKPVGMDPPKRVRLNRSEIRALREAGVEWSEIEAMYPDQPARNLRAAAMEPRGPDRKTACTICGSAMRSRVDAPVCKRCEATVTTRTCETCGSEMQATARRRVCDPCQNERGRVATRERMARRRKEAA